MTPPTLLLVEDDPAIARTAAYALEREGFRVDHVLLVREARQRLSGHAHGYAAAILDIGLPDGSGLDLCRDLRRAGALPIIILSARGDELDRVLGLELGADDYLSKPFSPRELLARLRAVLRRAQPSSIAEKLAVGPIAVDIAIREVKVLGEVKELTGLEFDILVALLRRAGRVIPRDALLSEAGRSDVVVGERTVDVHISHLRQKLGDDPKDPRWIKTVRGVGYVLAKEGA